MQSKSKKVKVVLINPYCAGLKNKTCYPPLGLLYIASYLEKYGFKPIIVNLADKKELKDENIPEADYYGITCTSATYQECKKIVHRLQTRLFIKSLRAIRYGKPYKKGIIVVGGCHSSVKPLETIDDMRCDIVCIGEGEQTMREIVQGKSLENIKGIAYRYKTTWEEETLSGMKFGVAGYRSKLNPPRPLIKNLDSLPFPARHLLPEWQIRNKDNVLIKKYSDDGASTSLCLSRGCPMTCKFCCRNHDMFRKVRFRSAKNIKKEIQEIIKKYRITQFRFNDDNFTMNKKWLIELCDAIKPLKIHYACITRADTLTEEICNKLKDSGCEELSVGVETGSPRLLKFVGKNETIDDIERGILIAKKCKLRVKIFLVHNLPTETTRDIELTKAFVKRVNPDFWTLSYFIAMPGSAFYEKYKPTDNNYWFYPKKRSWGRKARKQFKSFFDLEDWLKSDVWRQKPL